MAPLLKLLEAGIFRVDEVEVSAAIAVLEPDTTGGSIDHPLKHLGGDESKLVSPVNEAKHDASSTRTPEVKAIVATVRWSLTNCLARVILSFTGYSLIGYSFIIYREIPANY